MAFVVCMFPRLSSIIRKTEGDCLILRRVPEEPSATKALARAVGVEKRFGEVQALEPASVSFQAGEVHAVCGENGAGKSTLLKVIAGMVVPDAGHVEAFGARLEPHTPREAIRRGIGMVLQHFALVPVFTALENIVLGAEPTASLGRLDLAAARRRAEQIARDLGVDLPLDTVVETLGVGDRQRIEIARALYREAKLLILDEPTAVLTKSEAASLYATLRRLADDGTGIVVVTHKMDEVRAHADVVTVLRKGRLIFTRDLDRESELGAQIAEVTAAIMGGATGSERAHVRERHAGETVIALDGVKVGRALDGVTLEVKAGEIVGIAGVEGNGQRELVAVLGGDVTPDAGKVTGTTDAIVREDRHADGLVLDAPLRDNVVLGELGKFAGGLGWLDLEALESEARARLAASGANADLDRAARTLSGGNQQKIVVARALARLVGDREKALVAAQPTRGVDLGASRDIHARLFEARDRGAAVLVVSADLDELRALCTRILVLSRGKIVAELPPTASDDELGRAMLGVSAEAGA
ncbi:MAG: ATP-binding cassette domain-containing protein [Labilithrix sp.]|nr:ATP-binding cassette domain-containing protein [Labilithrix sp.]